MGEATCWEDEAEGYIQRKINKENAIQAVEIPCLYANLKKYTSNVNNFLCESMGKYGLLIDNLYMQNRYHDVKVLIKTKLMIQTM